MGQAVVLEDVFQLVNQLPARDKVRLIARMAPAIERELPQKPVRPRKSLWGLCADLGPAPSAEDIDKARREEWGNFPREDIF